MTLIPDRQLSLRFLRWLRPRGPWTLTCISTDKTKIETRTFWPVVADDGSEDADVLASVIMWLDLHGKRNLYYGVNEPTAEAADKKLSKSDVARVHFLHVDVDPREGEPLAAEQARIRRQLESYHVRPSALIFSGGGYNALWRLTRPQLVALESPSVEESVRRAIEVERRNWQFELDFQTPDHCRDVSRILRLPGTINWPTEKKLRAGREPSLPEIVWLEPTTYDFEAFAATPRVADNVGRREGGVARVTADAVRTESLESLKITNRLRVIISRAEDPDEPGRWGSDRSQMLYHACCEMVRQGLPDEVILGIITDSRYAISASVLDKGASVQRYALRQVRRARDHADHPMLAEMNDEYAIILSHGSSTVVMVERGRHDEVTGRREPVFQSFRDFKNRVKDAPAVEIQVGGKTKSISAYEWWTSHPRRRKYLDVAFEPGEETPERYNLWSGFAVQPRAGTAHLRFLDHCLKIVCRGDVKRWSYLEKWMARVVQQPRTQTMVAPVLLGPRGIGKSTFTETFRDLFGKHAFVASDVEDLTGKFNAHLSHCVLMVAEEAFDLRNKRHESVLKHLITGKTHAIERKGVDKFQLPNYVHLILTSNLDRVVPAGDRERRFFVTRVSDERTGDYAYFERLAMDRREGALECLLHHLLSVDVRDFNVFDAPATEELRRQQEHNLPSELAWLLERLHLGQWWEGHAGWEAPVSKRELHERYMVYMERIAGSRHGLRGERGFHQLMCEQLPGTYDKQLRGQLAGDRFMAFFFPPLEVCRREFAKLRGWGEDYDWQRVAETEDVGAPQESTLPGVFE